VGKNPIIGKVTLSDLIPGVTNVGGEWIVSSAPLGPDLILLNGKVFTADPACGYAQAVAISGNRISAVGTTNEIAASADSHTQRIDLGGRTAIPGIND
jgi:adenine deaminase